MSALAIIHRDTIIEQLQAGAYINDIATALGVAGPAISQVLAKDPEYAAAREIGAEARLERHQQALDTAADGLSLARAREGFKAQSWRCQAEFARWAPKAGTQINLASAGPMQVQIVSFAASQQSQCNTVEQVDDKHTSVKCSDA